MHANCASHQIPATSHSDFDRSGGDVSDVTAWPAVCLYVSQLVCPRVGWRCLALLIRADVASLCRFGVTLLHSAPVQGVSRPPHTASRDCRNGSPLARAIPCAPAPECGDTRKKEQAGQRCNEEQKHPAFLPAHPHAAQRAVPGWRGGLGRVGADLASAGSMRPPPSPTRHVSTTRQHGTARHHARQQRSSTPPHLPAEKRLATTNARRATATPTNQADTPPQPLCLHNVNTMSKQCNHPPTTQAIKHPNP